MLEIGLATESKQQEVLDASLSIQKAVENIQENITKPTTLLSVMGGSAYNNYGTPTSIMELLTSKSQTSYLMNQAFVKPVTSNKLYINPFTQTNIYDENATAKPYFNSYHRTRLYKDGILLAVGRGSNSSSTGGTYYYTFSVYKVRGYNDKGLPVYELLGSSKDIMYFSSGYSCVCNFFRKGDKVALLYGQRPYNDYYRMSTLSDLKMLQFDLTTKTMTTGSVSLSGITGLVTSSTFYFPTPTEGTLNDIDYGYLMYETETNSNYGKIKYRAEFNPDTTSITFTGKWEVYSTATDYYTSPIDPPLYPVTSVSYNTETDRLLYATTNSGFVYYGYNYKGTSPTDVKSTTTPEGAGGTLEPSIFEGVAYAYFELVNGLAIYKLNSSINKYEYVGTLSTTAFSDAYNKYYSYGLHHFGLIVGYQRSVGSSYYYDYHYADYTNELRELLGIGG